MPPRRPARRRAPYLQTVHALAACQSVLAPLCRRESVAFPPLPGTASAARDLWLLRLGQLAALGWAPVQSAEARRRALACPWGLFGLAGAPEGARPCRLAGCPSCHGHDVALLTEAALRVRASRPDLGLRLVTRTRHVRGHALGRELDRALAPPDPDCGGYALHTSVARGGRDWCLVRRGALVAGGSRGRPVPPGPLGVAWAAAWARRYPLALPLTEAEADPDGRRLLLALGLAGGRNLSTRTGVFRSPLAAKKLARCPVVIAPRHDPTRAQDSPPDDPVDSDFEVVGGDIDWATVVPDPDPDGPSPADLLAEHILDPADPETGDLVIPMPPGWGEYEDIEPDEMEFVPQSEAGESHLALGEDEAEREMGLESPCEVVADDREHWRVADAVEYLRDGGAGPLAAPARAVLPLRRRNPLPPRGS